MTVTVGVGVAVGVGVGVGVRAGVGVGVRVVVDVGVGVVRDGTTVGVGTAADCVLVLTGGDWTAGSSSPPFMAAPCSMRAKTKNNKARKTTTITAAATCRWALAHASIFRPKALILAAGFPASFRCSTGSVYPA